MSKAYAMIGYFLIGVSCTGLFSYTAYAIPQFQYYGFWLVVVTSILFIVAGVADEFFASAMGLSYQQYIGALISAIAIILIGGLIAWVH
jgi:ABC-type Na+ efflux pump permease subunit